MPSNRTPAGEIRPQTLFTARLLLAPLAMTHTKEMARVLGDPDLYRFIGGEPPSFIALRDRYRRILHGPGAPDQWWLNWVIRPVDGGYLVGTVQATVSVVRGELVASVAWIIGKQWQGRGYAKEAALALVEWLCAWPVAAVTASIHPDHLASSAVAAACGLSPTGEVVDGEVVWRRGFRSRA